MPITEKMELWSFLLAVLEISIAVPVTISTLRAHFGKKGGAWKLFLRNEIAVLRFGNGSRKC